MNSTIENINTYFGYQLNALSIQGCRVGDVRELKVDNKKMEYLEISNCGLRKLPKLIGEIKIVNFTYNKISSITEADIRDYEKCDRVILIGNKVSTAKGNFVIDGNLENLIPAKWYTPQ